MHSTESIQVFEYEKLYLNPEAGFNRDHWTALSEYNDAHGGRFFKLMHNGVYFQNFVGVIQAGDLTIEVLPKIGKVANTKKEKTAWQQVLIEMLRECNWMRVHAHEKATLQYKHNSILEAYLELFIIECESLLRQGLIKKYRQNDGNKTALKGKLLFSQNIQHNLVHQERFYTRHQVYDQNNPFNQILYKALKLIPQIIQSPLLRDRVFGLLLAFPELEDIKVNEVLFQNLNFDRKTSAYREGIEIAAMILLNYRPDIKTGQNNILAILFDMNELWEEYVYRQIARFNTHHWVVKPQDYKTVWKKSNASTGKGVQPDIVLSKLEKTLIIDTKWKLPEFDIPDDSDLKQMFMYNEYWGNANAVLLYPKSGENDGNIVFKPGKFIPGGRVSEPVDSNNDLVDYRHLCGIMKASVISINGNLNTEFGKTMVEYIHEKELL
jgi:5-methylcytosine-specific restriction enzyme subunit McrC